MQLFEEHLDASNVAERLWVGARPPADRRLERFTLVVLCAREYQPTEVAWTGRVTRARLDDDFGEPPTPTEIQEAVIAARAVATELHGGGQALVTCAMGLNRSALVASMALLMSQPLLTPAHVVYLMRRQRNPHCLSNPHFQELLDRLWSSARAITIPTSRGRRPRLRPGSR